VKYSGVVFFTLLTLSDSQFLYIGSMFFINEHSSCPIKSNVFLSTTYVFMCAFQIWKLVGLGFNVFLCKRSLTISKVDNSAWTRLITRCLICHVGQKTFVAAKKPTTFHLNPSIRFVLVPSVCRGPSKKRALHDRHIFVSSFQSSQYRFELELFHFQL
jgi:hypothetical protein